MGLIVRPCGPNELSSVLESMDREFVYSKGRSLSLSRRFPNIISQDYIEHIQVAEIDHSICGSLTIRMFDFSVEKHIWRGAMIGMVLVNPRYRGHGVGKQMMAAAGRSLHDERAEIGVLWTGIPEYYERMGWFLSDSSLLGERIDLPASSSAKLSNSDALACGPLVSMDIARLERVRSELETQFVIRMPIDYQVLPLPATDVNCFWASTKEGEGYALVGEADGIGYLYELVAPPVIWGTLWAEVAGRHNRLLVNGQAGDPFCEWLTEKNYVKWQSQKKTMWFCVSPGIAKVPLETWHIPYFDRI